MIMYALLLLNSYGSEHLCTVYMILFSLLYSVLSRVAISKSPDNLNMLTARPFAFTLTRPRCIYIPKKSACISKS